MANIDNARSDPPAGLPWEELLCRRPVAFDEAELARRLAGRRVLVTGAGGSVGSSLAGILAACEPASLVLFESHEPSLFHLRNRLLAARPDAPYRWALGDVRDERKLSALFRECRPEFVFHLAACKHVPLSEENVDQAIAVNALSSIRLVREAAASGDATFVYPSTDKAVRPPSIYGATKRVVERYLAEHRRAHESPTLRWVRLVNVFGTQGSVIETFARQLRAGEPLTITDRRMTRYWMTMREAALLLIWAATNGSESGPFILDAGRAVPMEEMARRLAEALCPGIEPALRDDGIRPGQRLHEELAYDYESLEPSGQPGVLAIRDRREVESPELPDQLRALAAALYDLERAELRRRLFELAAGV